ncbi:AAA family ATPase [Spirosoma sp. HMF3257]|uniref:ATPase AAA-type core domain-containing protein n=1 Tax=Spirosoma telluris TaxID=2183553 RepID=A0A327NRU5_9BACT|nr:AAA family ATPase [Spirosoma telluris]RAI77967.1 hypothetical protein HMF3257_34705 [Spirosoma telluris]
MLSSEVGSIWRKWDLHVHTPFSSLNNGFGSDWDIYVKALFQKAVEHNIYAIGITDYFTIEGYKKIKSDYLGNPSKMKSLFTNEEIIRINEILILPNIEFRLDILITDKHDKTSRVNFHVIFSEEVPIYQIEENFLHDIDFIKDGQPQNSDQKRKLKVNNLIEFGDTLKRQHHRFTESPLVIGMTHVSVSSSQICEILDKDIFRDKYILAVPCDEDLSRINWDSQGHNTRKVLIQKSDCLMASNPNTIAWGLGLKSKNFIEEFKSIKPSIWGSDAHSSNELFNKNKDRFLWVKSDLNFDGLKQIIHEPKRTFIGIEPEGKKLVELNSTHYLERLIIEKVNTLPSGEEWFDKIDIKLNSGLIAIIGNKGSGKTAIADILALCGNAKKPKTFSFLTSERFNKAPDIKGKFFKATVNWKDGRITKVTLFDKPIESESERVNYIPQSFLEKLCLPETGKGLFENELRKIIFSRIPIQKRLNKNSLDEIISFKTEVIRKSIELTKSDINLLNGKIIELEDQCKPEYRQKIYDEIDSINKRIIALYEKEPVEPKAVNEKNISSEKQQINEDINLHRHLLSNIDETIENAIEEREILNLEVEAFSKSLQAFWALDDYINKFISDQSIFLSSNNISVNSVFKYELDLDKLEDINYQKNKRLELINSMLDNSDISNGPINDLLVDDFETSIKLTSLYKIKYNILEDINVLQAMLDQPAKEYQEYLNNHLKWHQDLSELHSELEKLEINRVYINDFLHHVLTNHYKQREELLIKLYYQKLEILSVYKELYEPILKFKDNYKHQLSAYKIDFDAAFEMTGFLERFDHYINYAKSGSFYTKDDAAKKINTLISTLDFNNIDGVIKFTSSIIKDLLFDTRKEDDLIPKDVQSQLKQNIRIEDIYNYIYGLEYLEPIFQLKLAGKEIASLSPGERGALLLIFYLLLDNDRSPLIIDQPEENLDNQSIYSILVPFIQEAKERRQVILVTHNPNLAVVCDADQIIHVKIDKNNNYKVTCTSGTIENPTINGLLIEVLEGTFPAFDTRNQRYNVTRSRINKLVPNVEPKSHTS